MLTLDPVLIAAQSAQSRHPLIEIMSSEMAPSIPFTGSLLDAIAVNQESHPVLFTHSSGRLSLIFVDFIGSAWAINYASTDTARTAWAAYDRHVIGSNHLEGLGACEIGTIGIIDGYVGIIYFEHTGATRVLKYMILPETGGTALDAGTIDTFGDVYVSGPCAIRLADDSYLMAYVLYDAGTAHYHIYTRTSADFESWSAAAEIDDNLDHTYCKGNPSLVELTTGSIWLWFDRTDSVGPNNEELKNLYYSIDGAHAVKQSAYTGYGITGRHPFSLQKAADHQTLIFDEISASVHMDDTTTGWTGSAAYPYSGVRQLHYNGATGKLYIAIANATDPAVNEIDVPSWTVTGGWDTLDPYGPPATTPAFEDITGFPGHWHSEGKYVVNGSYDVPEIALLDATADTITEYRFAVINGKAQNVSGITLGDWKIRSGWLDLASNRLYVYIQSGGSNPTGTIGYLDITEAGPAYTFTTVVTGAGGLGGWIMYAGGQLSVWPAADIVCVNYQPTFSGGAPWAGAVQVFNLSTGALWKQYVRSTQVPFPYSGCHAIHYHGGKIYGGISYTDDPGEELKRGVCIIDLATDNITYNRPPWASVDEYGLCDFCETDDGKFIIASYLYGITLFDPVALNWTLYDNTSVPGLTPGVPIKVERVAYDPTTHMIFAGMSADWYTGWDGVIMFPLTGTIHRAMYQEGELITGTWVWPAAAPLVSGYKDYEATASLDPVDGGMYAVWVNDVSSDLSLKWAKDAATVDLTPQVVRGTDITLRETIDGAPAELSFTLASGHLFDPHNTKSLWRTYLKKGKKLTYRIGEKISGANYWAQQGTFYVSEAKMKGYERGAYPLMDIVARDEREIWAQTDIRVTPYYSAQYPEDIIIDLLTHYALKTPATDIDLPVFDARTLLWIQWIDKSLKDCIDEVARRYGYFVYPDFDGVIRARKITDAAAIDLTYTDNTKLIAWTPDDSFSDYTNQVIVHGEERDYIETLLEEKRVASFNTSHRWNTGKKDYTIWYSEDRSLQVRYPRMVVSDSVTSLMFDLAGECSEELQDVSGADPVLANRDKYCIIEIDSPDLTPHFVGTLMGLVASLWLPDWAPPWGGPTWPIGKYVALIAIMLALNILAATGNFSCEIWGRPVSKVRRSVQSDSTLDAANDYDFQARIGRVFSKSITDALCYNEADCNLVAAYEMMWAHNQRDSRVALSKIVDLRLQVADKIQGVHPYSNDAVTMVVTDRTRKVKVPEKPGGDGDYADSIEGWVIT